jgi:ABC-type dipeptide/oligopeptide/nickel transport system permease component
LLLLLLSYLSGGGWLPFPGSREYHDIAGVYKGSRTLNALQAFGNSSVYVGGSLLLTLMFAVPFAIIRAKRELRPIFPEAFSTLSLLAVTFLCSAPVFVIGYFIAHYANHLPWMPSGRWFYVIVALTLGNLLLIEVADLVETKMAPELSRDYIRAAISRGEPALWRKEYLLPLIGNVFDTMLQKIPILYGGIIVLEYSIPIDGLNVGGLLQDAYTHNDGWTLLYLSQLFISTMQLLKLVSERVSPEKLREI